MLSSCKADEELDWNRCLFVSYVHLFTLHNSTLVLKTLMFVNFQTMIMSVRRHAFSHTPFLEPGEGHALIIQSNKRLVYFDESLNTVRTATWEADFCCNLWINHSISEVLLWGVGESYEEPTQRSLWLTVKFQGNSPRNRVVDKLIYS